MTAKTRSRRIRDQRKHLRAMGILLIVMAVLCDCNWKSSAETEESDLSEQRGGTGKADRR